ncbi:MAG: hypothetical protein HC831_11760 [Chloroflexia bacterium]|nr:hypothetical protein [Chloroflexia bacterium]
MALKEYNEGAIYKEDIENFMSSMGYKNKKTVEVHTSPNLFDGQPFQEDVIYWK